MKASLINVIIISAALLAACGNKGLKTISQRKIYDRIKVREYTDTTNLGFKTSEERWEIMNSRYRYRIFMFESIYVAFTYSRFEIYFSTDYMPKKDPYRSFGKWYFKNGKLVLKCHGLFGKKFGFTLYTFKQANILVPDQKWLEFNTRMHEKPDLMNYLYHHTTGDDSTLWKPFNCLSEVALIRLNKE